MASHFGTNIDPEDATMVLIRKDFDEKKKALADAFARKARALAEMENIVGELSYLCHLPTCYAQTILQAGLGVGA